MSMIFLFNNMNLSTYHVYKINFRLLFLHCNKCFKMNTDKPELKYWYDLYVIHTESLAYARKMIIELGGKDPNIEALEKGHIYPYSSNIRKKIKFILKKHSGQKFCSQEIGDILRIYEPDMNQASINQFCSILGQAGEIGVDINGRKYKYYIRELF